MCNEIGSEDKRRCGAPCRPHVICVVPTTSPAFIAVRVLEDEIELEAKHFGRLRQCLSLSPDDLGATDSRGEDYVQLAAISAARALSLRCTGRSRESRALLSL
eukprot:TRINITY_DN41877_c4_g1_i1.p2 TRINITY_DN41877_c4_g1~~TRINITY_DN41877_c4_g1_i1.p2  ORF type:complete len:103 (+),score=7.50 TRINITY_DN41877_c4_g1_i1:87-395(+)